MTLPNFIGVGAPKSGTTWLANCLGEHPDVFMPKAKELVFFDYGDFDDRLNDYLVHFESVNSESAIGEFTTRYFASRRPAERIKKMIPEAKLIVCLRNPVDQIYSHYWHLARQNFHQRKIQGEVSFADAINRFPELLLRPAYYWDHLQHWLQHFPAEQFLILLYDDIQSHPQRVLSEVYRFIGVDPTFIPPSMLDRGSDVRAGKSPRSESANAIHARIYHWLSRKVYMPIKRRIGVHRASMLKDRLKVRQLMEWAFFRKGYPPMKATTRKMLIEKYAEQVAGLQQFLGRDLSTWK